MASQRTMLGIIVVVVLVAAVVAYLAYQSLQAPSPTPTTPTPTATTPTTTLTTSIPKITIQWGTASVGSAGYTALALIADVVNRHMNELEITVVPTAGAVASIKGYASGELGGCYASTPSFTELYNLSERFAGFKPARWPVQTFWAYTLEVTIAIHQKNLGRFTCWRDLNGKKIFTGPAGWDVGVVLRAGLKTLNITFEHVEIDWGMVPDSLERDVVVATIIYTTGGYGLPDWARQAELSVPLAILNPCPDEVEVLKARARELGIFEVAEGYASPKEIFATDVKLTSGTRLTGLRFYYGFHVGTEVPAEVVYRMLKVLEAHAEELAKLNPMFRMLAEDFVGVQVGGIEANRNVPVHPGLAKFLREKGAWRDEWKIAGS